MTRFPTDTPDKTTPSLNDRVLLSDSSDGGKASDATLQEIVDSLGIVANVHGKTSKTTPVDADEIPVLDSSNGFSLKKLTWDNIKATLKSYFDTIYQAALGYTAANDSNVVHKTGDENIGGVKSFLSNDTFFGVKSKCYGNVGNLGTEQKVFLDARSDTYSDVDIEIRSKGNSVIGLNSIKANIFKAFRAGSDNTTSGQIFEVNGFDHVYFAWLVNGIRKVYAGFASAGQTTFQIVNEILNADINIQTSGTGVLKINGVSFNDSVRNNFTTINSQTGTSYTLALGDAWSMVTCNNASAITVTVPPNSSVAFPIGTQIDLAQLGAGKVTLAQGAGVTISSKGGNKSIGAQYVGVSLKKIGTDTWLLFGDLIA